MWSSGPAVTGFLRSEGPSQVILGDEALGAELRPPPPFKAFSCFLLLFSDVRRRFEKCLHKREGRGGGVWWWWVGWWGFC